jgi:hypothetical protein
MKLGCKTSQIFVAFPVEMVEAENMGSAPPVGRLEVLFLVSVSLLEASKMLGAMTSHRGQT